MTDFDRSERDIWAGTAKTYADTFALLCAHPVPALLDAAQVRAGTRVLDVGTGPGTVARAAHERGATVTAVDADHDMVALAAEAVPAATTRVATLPELPFDDGEFDAVVANFVVNHVGRPRAALAELCRVARGRVAVTIWAAPPADGQALLGKAIQRAGVARPGWLPALAAADDFPRTEQGLTDLALTAGLGDVRCRTVRWDHTTTVADWWRGPSAGVATIGRVITSQPPEVRARIRREYEALCAGFTRQDGSLVLPHAALLAHGMAGPGLLGTGPRTVAAY